MRDRVVHDRRILGDRRHRVRCHVPHAETAADVQLLHDPARLRLDRGDEPDHLVDRAAEGVEAQDLRTDVTVQPGKTRPLRLDDASHRRERVTACDAEAELRVVGAGLDELVRVRLDARRHPDLHRGRGKPARDERGDAVELVHRVDDDAPDPAFERVAQLVGRLVVAVEDDARDRKARVQRDEQLPAAGDVEMEARFVDQLRHRGAEKRLARVRGAGAEVVAVLARPRAQLVFVVHVQRRAEPGGETDEVDPRDRHPAHLVDGRRTRQQGHIERGLERGDGYLSFQNAA